jgi:GxxExxY protein
VAENSADPLSHDLGILSSFCRYQHLQIRVKTPAMKPKDRPFQLCDVVRETAFAIHRFLGPGHLESVYENALVHRLRKQGLGIDQQLPLAVQDQDGTLLGKFAADVVIERVLILELKAARTTAPEHVAQLLGYLRSARMEHGALVNFGAPRLQIRM